MTRCRPSIPGYEGSGDTIGGRPAICSEVTYDEPQRVRAGDGDDLVVDVEFGDAHLVMDRHADELRHVRDVDLDSEDVVRVYRFDNPDSPTIYRRGDFAEGEPAVPGWSIPIDDSFD